MANYATFGIRAASARAWILAFLIDAGEMSRTFRVAGALGSAVWRRTDEFR